MKKKLLAVALCAAMIFSTVQQVAIATGDFAADTSSVVSETVENESSGTESYPESPISTEETSTEESTEESETSTEESSEAETSQESSASETSETNTDEQTSNSGNKIESGLANLMNQLIKPLSAASLTSTYALSPGTATSTGAAVYSDLTTSPAYQNYQDFRERYDDSASLIMPGMTSTYLSSSDSCDQMVPQGFCFADASAQNGKKYFLVSAYCGVTTRDPITGADKRTGDHSHQSVIYVLDADTKEYVTTIVLPTYGHVGGVCYDGKYVWYSISYDDNKKTGSSQTTQTVNGVKYTIPASQYKNNSEINKSNGVPKLVGGFDFNSRLTEIENKRGNTKSVVTVSATVGTGGQARDPVNTASGVTADCLTYNNSTGDINIARFVYPMNETKDQISSDVMPNTGNPGFTQVRQYYHDSSKTDDNFTYRKDIFIPCDRVQGMECVTYNGVNYVVVARSYVRNSYSAGYISMIEFYYQDKTVKLGTRDCLMPTGHCIVMPAMVEGVAYYNNRLYVTFESPATKYGTCQSRVDRIAALDISADLEYLDTEKPEYTRVIDLGGVTIIGKSNNVNGDSDGYEQVILDENHKLKNKDGAIINGKVISYNYNGSAYTQTAYQYNSAVASGEKLLVRLHDGFDLCKNIRTGEVTSGTVDTSFGGTGFKVASGGTLEIRSVQSINMVGGASGDQAGEIVIRRNEFGNQKINTTFTAAVVTAESGATVKITSQNPVSGKGKHAQVVFKGGTSNYVKCTDAMVNIKGGSCYMDGVTFRQIQGTTTNTHTAFRATGYYTADGVQIINCNFEDIYPVHSTTETDDGAAVFFDTDYNSPITLLENCTFDNSYDHSDFDDDHPHDPTLAIANPVYYAAVRYDGGVDEIAENTNDVEFKNLTFKNFANTKNAEGTILTAPKKGIIGFSNINWSNNICTRTPKQLRNITVEGITMQNSETQDSVNSSITIDKSEQTHYDGPLTFAKKIQNVDIKGNVLFENCKAWGAGAIAFDIDSVISNQVSISGSGVNRGDSANTDGTVKFVN